jgi:hypothetical protein
MTISSKLVRSAWISFIVASSIVIYPSVSIGGSYIPPGGFVKNEMVASKIADAILVSIYGEDELSSERPFNISLKKGIWIITGTLKPGYKGGVAEIHISKASGKILYVNHGK